MACRHDKGTESACGSTDYRYGYRAPDASYRSIMAYDCDPGECDNMPSANCIRGQFFSTPDPTYSWFGRPQGWAAGTSRCT